MAVGQGVYLGQAVVLKNYIVEVYEPGQRFYRGDFVVVTLDNSQTAVFIPLKLKSNPSRCEIGKVIFGVPSFASASTFGPPG